MERKHTANTMQRSKTAAAKAIARKPVLNQHGWLVHYLPVELSDKAGESQALFAIAPKKIWSSAVLRNRVKRVLRAQFKQHLSLEQTKGVWVVRPQAKQTHLFAHPNTQVFSQHIAVLAEFLCEHQRAASPSKVS